MLAGTQLTSACCIANTSKDYIQQINALFPEEFTLEEIIIRKNLISSMDNKVKTKILIDLLSN